MRQTVSNEYSKSPAVRVWITFREIERLFGKLNEKLQRMLTEDRLVAGRLLKRYELRARQNSVLFIGYAEAALGLGEAFRNMLMALDSAGMPFAI
jgi:hypothetical protein